ncbi:hypothetical protein [Tichowtungia aerotolerans]|uniref:Uncharacterized protein n=1 Tax=Tichowtungia aerotolerans TaxID=2697043 RepID=A0A6P1M780_9BACT|nr:hypothetical protein [Tichowtungia aerotolerans]QHI69707.1 hypothetical protein GT409_09665 [Tichowtungia aerotolerans]
MKRRVVCGQNVELRQGKLWVEEEHRFLKIGKPLRNFGDPSDVEELVSDLGRIKEKKFDCIELNCYWHHLDRDGDGMVDVDVEPLRRLIDAICDHGMFVSLSVETYGVGGGQVPDGFWAAYPDALAVGVDGKSVADTEYGYMSKVPSLFSEDYLRVSRSYISHLTSLLDISKILYFETTVEPQYMGDVFVDYSDNARRAYETWVQENGVSDAPAFPEELPVSQAFVQHPVWNRFRAEWLARWVNGDAQAFRDAAGADAWVAADYLDADEPTMPARCGDPVVFLEGLDQIDIIQVNWHWHNLSREPNRKAYERVRQVMDAFDRDWAITEHMTINGTDYQPEEMEELLRNTIRNSTHFGWEFVDLAADMDSPDTPEGEVLPGNFKPAHFAVYNRNWEPKPNMAVVDERWDEWMDEVRTAAAVECS